MPIAFAIDPDAHLVTYKIIGTATMDEALRFLAKVLRHPVYQKGFNFLGDRRDESAAPDAAYVRTTSEELEYNKSRLGPCRWALLVSSDVTYGMARMWGMMASRAGIEICPFRELAQATAWLDLEDGYTPPRFEEPATTLSGRAGALLTSTRPQ